MEHLEFPSEEKLQELRAKGEAPFSVFSNRCAVAAVVIGTAIFVAREFMRWYRLHLDEMEAVIASREPLAGAFTAQAGMALEIICIPIAVALLTSLVWGVVQTRFLVSFSKLRLELGRLRGELLRGIVRAPLSAIGRLFVTAALVGLAVILVRFGLEHARTVLLLGSDLSAESLTPVFQSFAILLVSILGICAILSWLIARWSFMYRHRMGRDEMSFGS